MLNHESDENQLREILNIFEQAELHVKELNDVIMKAKKCWSMKKYEKQSLKQRMISSRWSTLHFWRTFALALN